LLVDMCPVYLQLLLTNRNLVTSERPDASHTSVTDRAAANAMLGGKKEFEELMREAHRVGIKVLIDSTARISSSRYHRKYRPLMLYHLDETGKKVMLYGTDGKAVTFEDTAMLNYRKVEAWDLIVSDIAVWAEEHGVSGIRLENAQAWPMIMKANIEELSRRDTDGEPHYDPQVRQLATDPVI
jgi:1,4-alpha-glucan branching enzyme